MGEPKQIDLNKLTPEELMNMLFVMAVDVLRMAGGSGRFIMLSEGTNKGKRGWQMSTNVTEEGKAEEIITKLLSLKPDSIGVTKVNIEEIYQSQKGEIN